MNDQNKEPMSDAQLSSLLRKWSVSAPSSLEERVFAAKPGRSWWQFLLKGSIRVPVPILCCLLLLMAAAVWRSAKAPTCASASLIEKAPITTPVAVTCPANSRC